ncbi:type IV toxin-antitoxin system AbiEi family antitoxin domain-containing protein [Actinotalea fermentans]|uniref:AbiEi antitoxin N-terminal domain-containing protein n=1 Tax=Actinotalea fermentans TaxID=43671 RepID=A0A511Z175_9CELL|nr:type IV toxin-antitoxin system AbiEi family antitoxin domain-containing protein [Actinotalea fermentans]KGM15724.1 hypothetical protein N867_06065 [Actinotalea fermentans ATCC 43279 = JCM 9966 = DSM 3133]GEN81189.1 hypothetical protein AFE02nite_29230 [Actinotalea fermentans]
MRLTSDVVAALASRQAGVVTTAQLRTAGADDVWIGRQVASGRWRRLHRGVLLTYSGPITWRSRAWAGVLYAGPGAALSHEAAAMRHEFIASPPRQVDLTIPARRRVMPSPGLTIHLRAPGPRAAGRPLTTVRGDTVVDLVASAACADDAVGWVCAASRAGVSRAEILDAADVRGRFRNSGLLREIVAEVTVGIESPLERRYHRDVERRHRLPPARLQVREVVRGLWIRADAVYDEYGLRAELDGNVGHPGGRTDDDTWRDNAVMLATGDRTLRYRWRHVAVTPCETAAQVAAALRRGGWPGTPRPCSPTCATRSLAL